MIAAGRAYWAPGGNCDASIMVFKFIISKDNQILREYVLPAETRIGRRHQNDLVLEDATVSGKHAVARIRGETLEIQDVGSTNGTYVNGDWVEAGTTHPLQPGDLIVIGPYRISVQVDVPEAWNPETAEPSVFASTVPSMLEYRSASIEFTAGSQANVGRKLPLTKVVTTIGAPGMGVISLTRKLNLYILKQVEGEGTATVNNQPVAENGTKLNQGDMVRMGSIEFIFHID